MFQVVKQKFFNFIGIVDEEEVRPFPPPRKRRLADFDTDCVVTGSVKRRKQSHQASSRWSISKIFEFVTRKTASMKDQDLTRNRGDKRTAATEPLVVSDKPRRVLTPSRRFRSQDQERLGLRQISNSTVFDLTKLDEDDTENEESNNEDPLITKVFYNLSGKSNEAGICDESFHRTSKPYIANIPSVRTIKTRSRSEFLEESFRLEEKQRYKDILAKFTDVNLPEYSRSISPESTTQLSSPFTKIDLTQEDIHTNPLFYHKSFQKPVSIDLTNSFIADSNEGKKVLVDLTFVDPEIEYVEGSPSRTHHAKKTPQLSKDSVLDPSWIQQWRHTLDPIQLERDRLIEAEKRKLESIKKRQLEEIENLSKKTSDNEFPELTNEILGKVKRALAPGNSKEVFVEGFNAEITRGDISTLRDATWLNDEVVNFYFNLLKSRSESSADFPKVHVFNTFFYPKIMKTGHAGVKRWTRKVDIFAVDLILIPVHLGMHWCLAVIDFKNKEIVYYDSLKGNNTSCLQGLRKYLSDESMDKKKKSFDFAGWKELMPKDIPDQMNGCDCGVFMCKYAEYKSRYADFTFTQRNMPYFRKRMISEILSKKLM